MESFQSLPLEQKAQLLDQFLADSTDHIYLCNRSGQYLYVNASGLAALGLQPQDVLGKTWQDLRLPAETLEPIQRLWQSVFDTGQPVQGEMVYRAASVQYHEYKISPVWNEDRSIVEAVLIISRDVTDRKQTEALSNQVAEALETRAAKRTAELAIANESLQQEIEMRQQAVLALQESEERFRRAIVYTPFPMIIHAEDGEIVLINQVWEELTGYTHADIPTVTAWTERAYGHQQKPVREVIDCLYNLDKRIDEGEFTLTTATGEQRIWDFSSAPLGRSPDGRRIVISMAKDVTDRIQQERELQLIRFMVENSIDEISLIDASGKFQYVNAPLCKSLGYSREELLQLYVWDIDPHFSYEVHQERFALLQQCRESRFETQHRTKQGVIRDVEIFTHLFEFQQQVYACASSRDITDRKQAEAALREKQIQIQQQLAEIETIYQSAPIGLNVLDTELRFKRINQRLAEMNGLSVEEHLGRTVQDVLPDMAGAADQLLRPILETGEPLLNVEIVGETPAQPGVQRVWLESFLPLKDGDRIIGINTVCEEITDRKRIEAERRQSEAALRESEERYRTLTRNFPNGAVLLFDHNLRFLLAEGRGLAEIGLDRTFLEGKRLQEVFDPGTHEFIEPFYRNALAGYSQVTELPFADRIYQVYFLPVHGDENSVKMGMVVSQDITLQKQAEQTLRTARDELERRVQQRTKELSELNLALEAEIAERAEVQYRLEQLALELKRSNQELEQFAYIASHDLQEPLRAVTSFTQMLAKRYQGQLDAKADLYIEFIVDGATRMQQLIRDLLTYSRAGRCELQVQSVDCNILLERVKKNLQVAIVDNEAILTADPLPTLIADSSQVTSLLQNLISNALKYRSSAPPQIHVSAKKISQEAAKLSIAFMPFSANFTEAWLFSVQDNGIGIEPQYSERIFGIFQRLHTHEEYAGTGLGLAICKRIVERYGGQIWVESQVGQGSTFYFILPIDQENCLCDPNLG